MENRQTLKSKRKCEEDFTEHYCVIKILPVGGRADKVDNSAALLDKAEVEVFELKRMSKIYFKLFKTIKSKLRKGIV